MTPKETASTDYMAGTYFEYQQRYALNMRESDKALLSLMHATLNEYAPRGAAVRLLDIGCSNGNFLRHLRHSYPGITYWGGDLQTEVIEKCRADPSLAGVNFEIMNVRTLSSWPRFDVIIANAVLFRFPETDYTDICHEIGRSLVDGGHFFAFDFHHPFEQDLAIVDRSTWHPEGLMLHFRSYKTTSAILRASGFSDVSFHPFQIPIDLPRHEDPANIGTYTRRTVDGERVQFRGALAQPWCHLSAKKG